ncbi:MAG: DsbA family protein [Anaerolineae bacterium]|nr:DsbA family protein [Anaerolineae bacterium]
MSLSQETTADNDNENDYIYISRTVFYAVLAGLIGLILGAVGGYFAAINIYNRGVTDAVAAVDDAVNEAVAGAISESADSAGSEAAPAEYVEGDLSDDDPFLGPEDAPVTIVEFSDFFCQYCAAFKLQILPQILEEYGDQVRFVYRDFPAFGGDRPAEAAQCAGDQGSFWEYHDALFEGFREYTSTDDFVALAVTLDLDGEELRDCIESGTYRDEWNADYQEARALGVTGTPTFFINGTRFVGAQPFENFKQVIDAELENQ